MLVLSAVLVGCYGGPETDGVWTGYVRSVAPESFASEYEWNETEEGLRIEPGDINGAPITGFGGFYGRGVPMGFKISIPGATEIEKSDIPEDAVVKDVTFIIVLGDIDQFKSGGVGGYFHVCVNSRDEYYRATVKFEVSQTNEAFYEDNGKLYYKSNNKLVEHIYYGDEDENEDGISNLLIPVN